MRKDALFLADALSFTEKTIKPKAIIDLATLTGACIVSFGEIVAAYLTNDEQLSTALIKASEATGEKIWRLPLYKEYSEEMKSDIADIVNVPAQRNAGTIMGATFLKNFIEDTPWVHIDIAGTAWYSKNEDMFQNMPPGLVCVYCTGLLRIYPGNNTMLS
jgi:leucyl aminopeptidase